MSIDQPMEKLGAIHPLLPLSAGLLALIVTAVVADIVVKHIVVRTLRSVAKRSKASWDDALIEHNVVGRVVQLIPALVIFAGVSFVPGLPDNAVILTRNIAMGYMVLVSTMALTGVLSAANTVYSSLPVAKVRPIKGFVQLLQIVVWIIGGVLIVATLLDRSPLLLLSGFGAMTAILLLVFKDTILSLVASVQIKVQNWDKTITTIPTHRLISDSFKNWRGMQSTGARRIKRSILIDVSSIRFQSQEEINHFKRFALLKDYIAAKEESLAAYNEALDHDVSESVNTRRLTNVGTFRAYADSYLRNHPSIHKGMTLMVRQLGPDPNGLPLEIYCFTNTTVWTEYEDIQADIFDHLLAIIPEFGLRIYQQPAGSDLTNLCHTESSFAD
jgi:miniconductance mechanosensitive channel